MGNKKLTAYIRNENRTGSLAQFLDLARTETELRELAEYFIQYRELLRDEILQQLEQESDNLITKLHRVKTRSLLEETRCFRDILALQKRLNEQNEHSRD